MMWCVGIGIVMILMEMGMFGGCLMELLYRGVKSCLENSEG